MSAVTKLAPALIGVCAVSITYFYCGQDMQSTENYLIANIGTIMMAVQTVVVFILALTKNYVSGAFIIFTTALTALIQEAIF